MVTAIVNPNLEVIFDLTIEPYRPALSFVLFFIFLVSSFAYIWVKKKKEFQEQKNIVLSFYTFAFTFLVLLIAFDYRGYEANLRNYANGNFKVLEGTVDLIESYPTKTFQLMQVNGKSFQTKKGGSNSFSDNFNQHLSKGDKVVIEYTKQTDGIIKLLKYESEIQNKKTSKF